jgi:hypothetical protein
VSFLCVLSILSSSIGHRAWHGIPDTAINNHRRIALYWIYVMNPYEEREWQTRKKRIDGRLEAQSWKVVKFDPSRPLYRLQFIRRNTLK